MDFKIYTKENFQVIRFNEPLHLSSDISEIEKLVYEMVDAGMINIAIHFYNDSYL